MYRFSEEEWSHIEVLLQALPSFSKVRATARKEIEKACDDLLYAKKFYTSRAPDPKSSIEDFRKAEEITDNLRSHLEGMLRRRNDGFLEYEVLNDPYFPIDELYEEHQTLDESTGLKIVDFIELLFSLRENLRWIREHIQDDRIEFDLKSPGPRAVYDERIFFDSLIKVWIGAGGESSIGINIKRDGDEQFHGITLDFMSLVFRTLAGGANASQLQFRIPQPATLRAWCADIRTALRR